jgi:AraC-like DNA-binding protein
VLRSPAELRAELATLSTLAGEWLHPVGGEPRAVRPHDQLLLLSHQHTSEHLAQVYDPVVCLVVQGEKETLTTTRRHVIAAGEFLVVTHDMPVVSRITRASPDRPYLALILSLDVDILADLQHAARQPAVPDDSDEFALRVGDADIDLVDAFVRSLRALEEPNNAAVLLPLVSREIHYRLLNTPAGHTLRRLSLGQQPAAAVSKAIRLIRKDLSTTLSVPTIAGHVGLSPSALHHHFRAVTGTSPLQFQKQLRLLEARRLIQANIRSVTDAAYEVGYSSPTQFSREYRRAFNHPPSHDRLSTTNA